MSILAGKVRLSSSAMSRASSVTSTMVGDSVCWRAKASRLRVSVPPRWAASSAGLSRRSNSGSRPSSRSVASSRLPCTTARRFPKSCAMPPVSLPIASIFCAWRSLSSIERCSVMSCISV